MCYVKDGLSQNLPETFGCGGFGQVSEFFISIPYARHYNSLFIRNRSWILTIDKAKGHNT